MPLAFQIDCFNGFNDILLCHLHISVSLTQTKTSRLYKKKSLRRISGLMLTNLFLFIIEPFFLKLIILNTNSRVESLLLNMLNHFPSKLLFHKWAQCFSLSSMTSSFHWNRAGFCALTVREIVSTCFLCTCNCIPWKFIRPRFA